MEIPARPPPPIDTPLHGSCMLSSFLSFPSPLSSENQSLCRVAGSVKLPPSKFLQLCIFRLGVCELAKSGLPIAALFTFEAIRMRGPEKC